MATRYKLVHVKAHTRKVKVTGARAMRTPARRKTAKRRAPARRR